MSHPPEDTIPNVLIGNIERDLALALEEAMRVAAIRAFDAAKSVDTGHRAAALGQWRHFLVVRHFIERWLLLGRHLLCCKAIKL